MRRLQRRLLTIVRSFWFIPVLCVLSAIVLAESIVALDRILPDLPPLPVLAPIFDLGVEGSRGLLTGIGGTTFGAAATAFSITISVVATASTNYGPRLVGNFMSDRQNQWVLGVLVSTFVYTTLVVRTLRSATEDGAAFVPHIAVSFGILLAIADVFLVIAFIHHISVSIQVGTLTGMVQRRFRQAVRARDAEGSLHALSDRQAPEGGRLVRAGEEGYIVHIDADALVAAASADGGRVALECRVGDLLLPESPVARIWAAQDADRLADSVRGAIDTAPQRDPLGDVGYALQQMLELAVRAGEDPYTAAGVVEDLGVVMAEAVAGPEPVEAIGDESGAPRLYRRVFGLGELIDAVFDQARPFASGKPVVLQALVELAARIESHVAHDHLRGRAWEHVELIREACEAEGLVPRELAALDAAIERARGLVELSGREREAGRLS